MKTLKLKVNPRFGIRGLLNEKYAKGGLTLETLSDAQSIMAKVVIDIVWGKPEKDGNILATGGAEAKAVGLRQIIVPGQMTQIGWDVSKDKGKDVELSGDEIKLLTELIKEKNDKKEVKIDDLWMQDIARQLEIIK